MSAALFTDTRYLVRGRALSVFGRLCVQDSEGQLIAFGVLRAEWSKRSITLLRPGNPEAEILSIRLRPGSNISDVVDARSAQRVGALQRAYWVPFARDQWTILDADDRELGVVREESTALSWLKRLWPEVIPRRYRGEVEERTVCTLRQLFSPFAMKIQVDVSDDFTEVLDRRLVIAVALLLCELGHLG
ncbi:MAG: hypothetical protein IMF16_01975 [Proteobacteria bacterium]|nr:hypothetical protein [Pseudomonadota bacterium]